MDAEGQPRADAGVWIEPAKAYDNKNFIIGVGTDAGGRFTKQIPKKFCEGKDFSIWVRVSGNAETLAMPTIDPPFRGIRRFDRSYDGQPIALAGKDNVIDVGDLKVQFWYGEVKLNFPHGRQVNWKDAWIRIKNEGGRLIDSGMLSTEGLTRYVTKDGAELRVSLPEGKWTIQILRDDYNGPKIAESPLFEIKRNSIVPIRMRYTSK